MHISSGAWWLKRILSANSLADLRESVAMIVQRIGFRHFAFRGRYPHLRGGHEIRLDNCPTNWSEYCSRHGLDMESDPMHQHAMHEATPVLWREWVSHYPAYFVAARNFGFVTGVTHPVHGPSGDRSSTSFIKGVGGVQAEREILVALAECQLIACYVRSAVARIIEHRFDSAFQSTPPVLPALTLTDRERECLTWAATGKTAAEVATTLCLSESTIIYHLSRARRKLDAANSSQAITKAISLKLIAPG